MAGMSLSIDDTEDMLKEPLNSDEDLLDLCQRLEEKPYQKKVNIRL